MLSEAAHNIVTKALTRLREHPELWHTGDLCTTSGKMCALGFLNEAAGRARGQMVYPQSAVSAWINDPEDILAIAPDDPLMEATTAVAACGIKTLRAHPTLGVNLASDTEPLTLSDPDRVLYRLNDHIGRDAVESAFECAIKEK